MTIHRKMKSVNLTWKNAPHPKGPSRLEVKIRIIEEDVIQNEATVKVAVKVATLAVKLIIISM